MNLYLGISLLCASQAAATLLRGAPEGVHVISQSDRHLVNQDWTQMIEDFKPMVVNVEATSEVTLETESTGRWLSRSTKGSSFLTLCWRRLSRHYTISTENSCPFRRWSLDVFGESWK